MRADWPANGAAEGVLLHRARGVYRLSRFSFSWGRGSGGEKLRGFAQRWFPKGRFWRMFPDPAQTRTRVQETVRRYQKTKRGYKNGTTDPKNRNEGMFAKTALFQKRPFVSSRTDLIQCEGGSNTANVGVLQAPFLLSSTGHLIEKIPPNRKISPKLHAKNVVKNGNFTQISLCWGVALGKSPLHPGLRDEKGCRKEG